MMNSTPEETTALDELFGDYSPRAAATVAGGENVHPNLWRKLSKRNQTILIVDDNELFRSTLFNHLAALGCNVNVVSNGRDAFAQIGKQDDPLDLLIADLCMDGMNGIQLLRNLRHPAVHTPRKILLLSGMFEGANVPHTLGHLGVDKCLSKNISEEELLFHIKSLLFDEVVDQRSDTRVTVDAPVDITVDGETFCVRTENIGRNGMFVVWGTPPPTGTRVSVRFHTAPESAPITCAGTVAWVNPPGKSRRKSSPVGIGIVFTDMSPVDADKLERFVADHDFKNPYLW